MEDDRAVDSAEGQKLAEHFSSENCKILFAEVSAKTGEGVQEAFHAISKKVKEEFERENVIKPVIKIAKVNEPLEKTSSRCAC